VKGADASPMDFFGFGYLKHRISLKRPKTLAGLTKIAIDEWKKLTPEKCQKVFENWKKRLRLVHEHDGYQIETLKSLHSKKSKN